MWEEVWVPGESTWELVSSYWLLHIFASHPDDYSQLKYVDNGVQSPTYNPVGPVRGVSQLEPMSQL